MPGDKARGFALSKIGQGYIYGAKGQTCTPAFRHQQAEQYPKQAEFILGVGSKWDGLPVWDCAQLTRYAAKAEGISLPSGATSQWRKGKWARKGTIDTLPEGEVVWLYRESNKVMQHTGIGLGDGTCVHAAGTRQGVIHQSMAEYPWTHWASPWSDDQQTKKEEGPMIYQATVSAQNGYTVRMRSGLGTTYSIITKVPIGSKVDVLGEEGEWKRIRYNGKEGYMMSQYLSDSSLSLEQRLAALEARVAKLESGKEEN